MTSGYSGTPLAKKLGIKEGSHCVFLNTPPGYFNLILDAPEYSEITLPECSDESVDFIHLFVQFQNQLHKHWKDVKPKIKKGGMIWVSWPKGSSQLDKDLDGNFVRKVGLDGGLVDVKVCAIDEDWSGLKFMYRKEDR